LETQKTANKAVIAAYSHINLDEKSHLLSQYLPIFDHRIELKQIDSRQEDIRVKVDIDMEQKLYFINKKEQELVNLMNKYKRPGQEISQKFAGWEAETINLATIVDDTSLNEYEDLCQKIKGQELEQHQEKFNTLLNENMIRAMTSYRESFNNHQEEIKENIDNINQSLQKIIFSKQQDTYIKIEYRNTTNRKIQDFKEMLNAWQPNQGKLQWLIKKREMKFLQVVSTE